MRTSILFVAAALGACVTPRATSHALPFLEDQYPAALEQARARGVPLFIDLETSW